jgi:uncharacterized protein
MVRLPIITAQARQRQSPRRLSCTIYFLKWLRILPFAATVVLATALLVAAEPVSSLKPSNYVNDFAGVLDAATVASLNSVARQVDEKAKAQIAVVTVKSTDGEDVVAYAVDLYQKWGIGKKGSDRGVLILFAVQDRKYWTTVGYGLEPILPDGKVGGFGREAVPLLRNNDYSGAASLVTLRVSNVIAQDAGVTLEGAQAPEQPQPFTVPNAGPVGVFVLIAIVVVVLLVLRGIFRGGGGRGGGSGILSGLLWGMLFNSLGSRGGGSSGGWGGGSSWGGGGFGGGGGGFGGFGGGSTGGGGAGGSW